MKTILSSRRHCYLARVSIFLIMVALIAGMVSCGGTSTQYTLSVSSSSGGTVIHPGIGTFTYPEGAVVLLEAVPAGNYSFSHWSGNVSTIANINAPSTTITMNGHYFITANFAPDGFELIWDWYDLDAIRNNLSASYLLMNDLDEDSAGYFQLASPTANSGKGWEPIGILDLVEYESEPFTGLFNGQEYKIEDLYINRPEENGIGLFACIGGGGVIRNIGVVNGSIIGGFGVGGLVGASCGPVSGYNSSGRGTLSNCYATGSVTGNFSVGGLVGINDEGNVNNCHATGTVSGNTYVGGLAGANAGNMTSCYSTGIVSCNFSVGGLAGINGGDMTSCYATGTVSGDDWVGGLVGANGGNITNCYATGTVSGNSSVGGLVGFSIDPVLGIDLPWYCTLAYSNSYATGNVTGNEYVGGLVGVNAGPATNCHSMGSVTGNSSVGGLVGANVGNVTNCYSTGSVTGNFSVGGLVGENTFKDTFPPNLNGTVTNSFWDTETSGQNTSDGGTGKNTTEMQYITTFSGAGWNITTVGGIGERNTGYIWNIVNSVTYPFLSWQP